MRALLVRVGADQGEDGGEWHRGLARGRLRLRANSR